ncbi:hypothetical protein D3C76_1460490 [compost metagenome]
MLLPMAFCSCFGKLILLSLKQSGVFLAHESGDPMLMPGFGGGGYIPFQLHEPKQRHRLQCGMQHQHILLAQILDCFHDDGKRVPFVAKLLPHIQLNPVQLRKLSGFFGLPKEHGVQLPQFSLVMATR